MDTVNELGKELKKTRDRADRALKKASPEYGMAERARDIFDPVVPYTMSFRVPRKGMQVRANMQFEYPPPNGGSGGCCGDCYCAICETFLVSEITGTSILLNRPYEPGSIRVYNGDIGISVGVNESDPDAGIVYIDSCFGADSVTICYVYKYVENCTHLPEMNEYLDPCGIIIIDDWNNRDTPLASANTDRVLFGAVSMGSGDYWVNGSEWNTGEDDVYYGVENGTGRVRLHDEAQAIVLMCDGASPWFPWYLNGAGVPDELFSGTSVMFSIDVSCDRWSTSILEIYLGGNYSNDFVWFELNGTTSKLISTLPGADIPDIDFTYVNSAWYTLKVLITGTQCAVKLWVRGTTEPDWMGTGGSLTPMPWLNDMDREFDIMMTPSAGPGNYTNYYFDNFVLYPCVDAIPLTILDTFDRTITGNIIDNQFGYSANPVQLWYASGPEWSCDGTYVILDPQGAGENYGAELVIPYDGVDTTPAMPWQDDQFLMEFRFKYTANVYVDDYVYFQITFSEIGSPPNHPTDFVFFNLDTNSGGPNDPWGYLGVKSFDGNAYTGPTQYYCMTPAPDSWYKCKIEKTSTFTFRAKMWLENETEPDWQVSCTSGDYGVTKMDINGYGFTYSTNYGKLWIDYIAFGAPTE